MAKSIALLQNPIQEYLWGSKEAIPKLLRQPCPSQKPQAELWMGAHPKAPSLVLDEHGWIPLPEWIESDPESVLGKEVAARFSGKLPFLFKVLAAEKPLSIQAHPNRQQARDGFNRENSLGIPLNAPERNYRDDNHKPELICAMSPFWALNGFREASEIIRYFEMIPEKKLAELAGHLKENSGSQGLKDLFSALMNLEAKSRAKIVDKAVQFAKATAADQDAFRWLIALHHEYPGDIGVLSPLFLRLVLLNPGEAMYLKAGSLHAYLKGVGVELMANSDNVLRGGLTPKHIDVPELLKVVRFVAEQPAIIEPDVYSKIQKVYKTPAEEFELSSITIRTRFPYTNDNITSIEIMLCTSGSATIIQLPDGKRIDLGQGDSIVIPASTEKYTIEGEATFYKASVPLQQNS